MYTQFYGLREKPFSLSPDPRYLFLADSHREALAHLLYGIEQGEGFIAITGEVGTGKTTLCRTLLQRIEPGTEVSFIFNPQLSPLELLQGICAELGLEASSESRRELTERLNRFLLEKKAEGRRVLLIIDEAQNLSAETLEQVRLLSNLETDTSKLVQIILIGQPELDVLLESHQLRQLRQRISVRWRLKPLSANETRDYVRHRLRIAAGAPRELFTELALREVHRRSRGVPRVVNLLCDRALLAGYASGARTIGLGIVTQTDREIRGGRDLTRSAPSERGAGLRRLLPLAAVLVAGLVGGYLWQTLRASDADLAPVAASPPPAPVSRVIPPIAARPPRLAQTPRLPKTGPTSQEPAAGPTSVEPRPVLDPAAVTMAPNEVSVSMGASSPAASPRAAARVQSGAGAEAPAIEAPAPSAGPVTDPRVATALAPARTPAPRATAPVPEQAAPVAENGAPMPAVSAPAPTRAAPPAATIGADDLATALARTAPAATTAAAFDALLTRWHVKHQGAELLSLGEALRALPGHGLRALPLSGVRLSALRHFDRPSLVSVRARDGGQRVVLLERLDAGSVRLAGLAGAKSLSIPLAQFEASWTGDAWVVWRDFEALPALLRSGQRGAPVAWLQQSLARLGYYHEPTSGVYDQPTIQAVEAFQASRRLRIDGTVGPVTKIALYDALGRYNAPQLTPARKRAG